MKLYRKISFLVLWILLFNTALPVQAGRASQALSIDGRIPYQRALDAVTWKYTLFPSQAQKPSLAQVLPSEVSQRKVEDSMRQSNALAALWSRPLTPEQLQAEIQRIARQTKQPELLREQWRALNNDPQLIAEMQVRPLLADRLLRAWYGRDERIHGEQYGPVRRCWCGVSILSCWIHPSTAIPPQPTTGLAPLYSALRMRAADSRAYGLEQS